VVVAADTRLSTGYSILSRNSSKIVELTPETLLITSGMYADFTCLSKTLKAKLKMYEFNNGCLPKTDSIATLLSRTLYYKRYL